MYQKLGLKSGASVLVIDAPTAYYEWLDCPFPTDHASVPFDFVHLFAAQRASLRKGLSETLPVLEPNGMIWVSWPKKAAKVPTDITEDIVREEAFPLGLVDIKVCSVSEIWSGLKLVIRLENRKSSPPYL